MSEQRFDRIEKTLDKLTAKIDTISEVIIALARIEEKHVAVKHRLDSHEQRLNKHSEEIDVIQVDQAGSQVKTNTNEWFVRMSIAALVGLIVYLLRGV
jgi:predicted  nucleic acid-binding Zn-ribbon protein